MSDPYNTDYLALGLDYGTGQTAFTSVRPKAHPAEAVPLKKRGPRADGPLTPEEQRLAKNESAREYERRKRNAELLAKATAYSPSQTHKFALAAAPSTPVKVASSRFATL